MELRLIGEHRFNIESFETNGDTVEMEVNTVETNRDYYYDSLTNVTHEFGRALEEAPIPPARIVVTFTPFHETGTVRTFTIDALDAVDYRNGGEAAKEQIINRVLRTAEPPLESASR
jgi:hypothetical protein